MARIFHNPRYPRRQGSQRRSERCSPMAPMRAVSSLTELGMCGGDVTLQTPHHELSRDETHLKSTRISQIYTSDQTLNDLPSRPPSYTSILCDDIYCGRHQPFIGTVISGELDPHLTSPPSYHDALLSAPPAYGVLLPFNSDPEITDEMNNREEPPPSFTSHLRFGSMDGWLTAAFIGLVIFVVSILTVVVIIINDFARNKKME